MKKFIILLFILCFSCNKDKNRYFEGILKSLSKNYANSVSNSNDLECWKTNKNQFIKDSIEYKKGLKEFYKQETDFIKFLIEKKAVTNEFNIWIKTKNPCSSYFNKYDKINNQLGVIILVDNLLSNNCNIIVINDYVNKIKITDLIEITKEKQSMTFMELKNNYRNYINSINEHNQLPSSPEIEKIR